MSEPTFERTAARADLCRLLAACYYQPGPEFAEENVFDAMSTAATTLDPELAAQAVALGASFAVEPLGALEVDYTRLFLSPTGPLASPYESAWVGGEDPTARHQAMQAVLQTYRDGGFQVDEDFGDLPDHIATEIEFLYALIFREARAQRSADATEGRLAAELRAAFVDRHLGRWIGPFAEAMQSGAETGFYRTLAGLTERFVGLAKQ